MEDDFDKAARELFADGFKNLTNLDLLKDEKSRRENGTPHPQQEKVEEMRGNANPLKETSIISPPAEMGVTPAERDFLQQTFDENAKHQSEVKKISRDLLQKYIVPKPPKPDDLL